MQSAYDRWVTTQPDSDGVCPKCGEGEMELISSIALVSYAHCDGLPVEVHGVYGESPTDEGILQIIGEERRGEAYTATYAPCPDFDAVKHDAHEYQTETWYDVTYRCSACRHTVKTVEM